MFDSLETRFGMLSAFDMDGVNSDDGNGCDFVVSKDRYGELQDLTVKGKR